VEIAGFALSALSAEEQTELRAAYARDIATTCGVNHLSVVDTQGKNASVSIGEEGTVSAFVLSIGDGFSANMLAARLYSSAFRSLLEDTTLAIGGQALRAGSGQISVGAVTFKPEAFVPPIPTTTTKFAPPTATSTGTSTATGTATSTSSPTLVSTAAVTTTEAVRTSTSTSTGTGAGTGLMHTTGDSSGPDWWWFVIGGVAVGAAAAVVMLLVQKARKGAEELPLHV